MSPMLRFMVIEHAERSDLPSLHQLRGRVGRGAEGVGVLLLYPETPGEAARSRARDLRELRRLRHAREDLMLRGPGEYLAARQSGRLCCARPI